MSFRHTRRKVRLVSNYRNLALWVVIAGLLFVLFQTFNTQPAQPGKDKLIYSELVAQANNGNIKSVRIEGGRATGMTTGGDEFVVEIPAQSDALISELVKNGVAVDTPENQEGGSGILGVLLGWFPMLLLIGVWIFFMRQMQGGGGKAMGFGKSKAKLLTERHGRVTFDDVAGIDEAKDDLA